MQSHYEINVSLNGKHFFATHERSARSFFDAKDILKEFFNRFPSSDGFEITCTHWEVIGKTEDIEKMFIPLTQTDTFSDFKGI